MKLLIPLLALCTAPLAIADDDAAAEKKRLAELDTLWAEVSRAVNTGDFEAYRATCHPDGVLVAGTSKACYPLSKALARWKKEFDDTKAGKMKASVEFRFAERLGDATTAHESGMFLYSAQKEGGEPSAEHIHFEALLLRGEKGEWLVMMEYQKSKGTAAEWRALAKPAPKPGR